MTERTGHWIKPTIDAGRRPSVAGGELVEDFGLTPEEARVVRGLGFDTASNKEDA